MHTKNKSSVSDAVEADDAYVAQTTDLDSQKSDKLDLSWGQSFWEAARRSTPNILTMIFFQFVQLLNIFYIGQIGSEYLAGVGMGNMLLNVCIFAFSNGFNGTVETFISWALGSNDF